MTTNGAAPPLGRVHISQCLHRYVNPFNSIALLKLFQDHRGRQFGWGPEFDAMISRSRSIQATLFYMSPQMGDVLVFLDDDIGFEPEAMHQLIETCEATRQIAVGMYVARESQWPHPTLAAYPGTTIHVGTEDPPVEIQWGATGFMAIHRDVLNALAKTMDPCTSGPKKFIPFFLPWVHEGEFLSEDYAFCQRAIEAGFKTYCDPRIRLQHEGRRAYTISDLSADVFSQQTTFTIDEGGPDVTSVIPDLCHYLDKSPFEIQALIQSTQARLLTRDEWNEAAPRTVEEVQDFYGATDTYLMELVQFNLRPHYNRRCDPALGLRGKVLDFGGGIGTLTIRMGKTGMRCTYLDLPSPHRDFAEYRFKQHQLEISCHSDLSEFDSDYFDGITAVDVLEHIHPEAIEETAFELFRVLKPGGRLIELSDFDADQGNVPHHFECQDLWERAFGAAGFVDSGDDIIKPLTVGAHA